MLVYCRTFITRRVLWPDTAAFGHQCRRRFTFSEFSKVSATATFTAAYENVISTFTAHNAEPRRPLFPTLMVCQK